MTYLIAKLLRRDPRMVERKKTGKAKARKGVSCSFLLKTAILITISVHLGQAIMVTFYSYILGQTSHSACIYNLFSIITEL